MPQTALMKWLRWIVSGPPSPIETCFVWPEAGHLVRHDLTDRDDEVV
jgi:hypothetical protein